MNHQVICGDSLEVMQEMPDGSVDIVFSSPPYALKTKRYGSKKNMTVAEWVDWMSGIIKEACRVSRGFVLVNANNPVVKGRMFPANEHLVSQLDYMMIRMERPAIWHKNSPSNKRPWFVNDWEPVMAFYTGDRPTVWNWEAIATPPKFKSGGKYRQRDANGNRRIGSDYPQNKLTRPRDVFRVTVGGGHMGSKLASLSEAPFPEKLPTPFIKALTNHGDTAMDMFAGSGTLAAVCEMLGRHSVNIDNRQSQVDLMQRRIEEARNRPSLA